MERGQGWGEDAPVGLGEQHRDPAAQRGELVVLGMGQPEDEPLAPQPAQIVGGLAAAVGPIQQRRDQPGQVTVGEPDQEVANPTSAAKTAMTRGSPKRSPGACRPSGVCDGRSPG